MLGCRDGEINLTSAIDESRISLNTMLAVIKAVCEKSVTLYMSMALPVLFDTEWIPEWSLFA